MNEAFRQHGAFSWAELATTDMAGAKKFYTELLGWETEEVAMTGVNYTVIKVGGVMELSSQEAGAHPFWGNYVTVDDVDATALKAGELGGTIVIHPTDIPNVGRFATLRDPQGAMISVITYLRR